MAPTSLNEPNAPSMAGYFTDKWRKDKTKQTNENNNKITAAARSWRPCWSVVALTLEGQVNHQKVRNLVCMCFLKMVRRAVVAEKIGAPGCFCKTQQPKPRSWTHLLTSLSKEQLQAWGATALVQSRQGKSAGEGQAGTNSDNFMTEVLKHFSPSSPFSVLTPALHLISTHQVLPVPTSNSEHSFGGK